MSAEQGADIVERLRAEADSFSPDTALNIWTSVLLRDAADEIERLRRPTPSPSMEGGFSVAAGAAPIESGPDLLSRLGMDAAKWCAEMASRGVVQADPAPGEMFHAWMCNAIMNAHDIGFAAGAGRFDDGWCFDMEQAPKGETIWVWCPAYERLDAITSLCQWHDDAGFCVDELRSPVCWRRLNRPAPPGEPAAAVATEGQAERSEDAPNSPSPDDGVGGTAAGCNKRACHPTDPHCQWPECLTSPSHLEAVEAARRITGCDYGMVNEDDARTVASALLSALSEGNRGVS